jgi:hypothetical protein
VRCAHTLCACRALSGAQAKPKKKRLEDSGISTEELHRRQQELFAKSKNALRESQEGQQYKSNLALSQSLVLPEQN